MAKQLIEYDYDGMTVRAEVDVEEEEQDVKVTRAGERLDKIKRKMKIEKATVSLDQAFSTITPTAQAITDQINNLCVRPQTAEVGFGLIMKANMGAVLASAGVEANMSVRLTWDFSE